MQSDLGNGREGLVCCTYLVGIGACQSAFELCAACRGDSVYRYTVVNV